MIIFKQEKKHYHFQKIAQKTDNKNKSDKKARGKKIKPRTNGKGIIIIIH